VITAIINGRPVDRVAHHITPTEAATVAKVLARHAERPDGTIVEWVTPA